MSLDGQTIEQFTQGINAPVASQDGYFAIARANSDANGSAPNLSYEEDFDVLGYRLVRTLDNLPDPGLNIDEDDDDVITLESGHWIFPADFDLGTSQLDILQGATVRTLGSALVTSSHATRASVRVRNTHNLDPFRATNTGGGPAVRCFSLEQQWFRGWRTDKNIVCDSLDVRFFQGEFAKFLIQQSVDEVRIAHSLGAIAATGSGPVGWIEVLNHKQGVNPGSAGPCIEIEDGIRLLYRLRVAGCLANAGKLLVTGSNLNDSPANPFVTVSESRSATASSITCDVVPSGGLIVRDCVLNATPFSGFTHTTTSPGKVISRGNVTTAGTPLSETALT